MLITKTLNNVGIHVLVIGVGYYNHKDMLAQILLRPQTDVDIDSATNNALAVANFLLADSIIGFNYNSPINNRKPPGLNPRNGKSLASIEILCGNALDPKCSIDGDNVGIAHPTFSAIKEAYNNWLKRLNLDPEENFGIFYYSGHGFHHQGKTLLSTTDHGQDGLFSNVIDFTRTFSSSIRKTCCPLVYFLDCCRSELPAQISEYAESSSLVDPTEDAPRAALAQIFYACHEKEKASGTEINGISLGYFTRALLDVLEGASASLETDGWVTLISRLFLDLKRVMRWYQLSDFENGYDIQEIQVPEYRVLRGVGGYDAIQVLPDPSNVYLGVQNNIEFPLSNINVIIRDAGTDKVIFSSPIGSTTGHQGPMPRMVNLLLEANGNESINRDGPLPNATNIINNKRLIAGSSNIWLDDY